MSDAMADANANAAARDAQPDPAAPMGNIKGRNSAEIAVAGDSEAAERAGSTDETSDDSDTETIKPADDPAGADTHSLAPSGPSTFPFFDFPRELRDDFYEYLLVPVRRHDDPANNPINEAHNARHLQPICYVHNGPNLALLTVNKQFSSEYADRARSLQSLSIRTRSERSPHLPLAIPSMLRSKSRIEIWLLFSCNHDQQFSDGCARPSKLMLRHLGWVRKLIKQLPANAKVKVRGRLTVPDEPALPGLSPCEKQIQEDLDSFDVWPCIESVSVSRHTATRSRSYFTIQWSRKGGLTTYEASEFMDFENVVV